MPRNPASPESASCSRGGGAIARRAFLARALRASAAGGALAAPWIAPARALGLGEGPAPSDTFTVGCIGVGGRGMNHVDTFLYYKEARILAVCDPYRSKRDGAAKKIEAQYGRAAGAAYKGCLATSDFREITDRPDIDCVVIASPENWHALQAIAAVRAGKDVYCEKALSRTVAEGRAVVEAVRKNGRILQVGTQQRSDRNFRFAAELALNGYLGKLQSVKVAVPGGQALPVAPPAAPPPDLDYEMWLGPAPWTPYNELKCTYNWYFMADYCAGWIQSWGVHHIDSALWGAPSLGQGVLELEGAAVYPKVGLADTCHSWKVEMRAGDGLRCTFTDEGRMAHGVRFEGDKGWVHVVRGGIQAGPTSLLSVRLKPNDVHLYDSGDHHGNFIECMRTRRDPVAPVEAGHRATSLTLVSDIACRLGKKLSWDWAAERFVKDEGADRLLRRPLRAPWAI